jgi:dienelactone hydrolase
MIEDGTLISISPPRIQEGCCVHDVTYSSDGLKLTGILTRPCKGGPFPAIVANHGGFGDAKFFDDYRGLKFAKAGYVVFSPDYRGTRTSEGRNAFRIENSNIIRERTFQRRLEEHRDGRRVLGIIHDILNGIKFVKTLPYVDKNRIAIFGHSMGHIASRLTLERTSEVRAAVLVAAFLVENPAELKKISCPVMLAYGDQDKTAPPEKGLELRDILRKYGKHVEFQIFYGKDHSTIVDAALDRALAFYEGQLKRRED